MAKWNSRPVRQTQQLKPAEIKKVAPVQQAIGLKEIRRAQETLREYREGRMSLERRIISNEKWWKIRHWEEMKRDKNTPATNPHDPEPASGWLFNSIIGKHADFMDAFPEPNILPRSSDDKEEAERLSSIVPVVLEQNDFEETYSDVSYYKLKQGTGVYGVFWDPSKLNGLGDISVKQLDILNVYWEPGIKDIQKSKNLFITEAMDNDILEEIYPETKGKLGSSAIDAPKYEYDDNIDYSKKSLVVDWYYHKYVNGKKTLQFCKFVNDIILYASENDTQPPTQQVNIPQTDPAGNPMLDETGQQLTMQQEIPTGKAMAETGWYEHGEYPVVFDCLFPEEGTCYGFGYIDACKATQRDIDILNQAILKNAVMGATPRYLKRNDGGINEQEFADWTKPIVHVDGSIDDSNMRPIETKSLDTNYINVLTNKIEELKEVTGNRDVNNGGTTGGVTAASAIAAMQEASGRTSRDASKSTYRAYSKIVNLIIELIRQFYSLPRQFRITGMDGNEEYVMYSNQGLQMQSQGSAFGMDLGMRKPVFDIKVSAQKQNPYSKLSQNELAIQLYGLGIFNPEAADQALAMVQMMDFEDKNKVVQTIQRNGTLYEKLVQTQQQMLQMAEIVDRMQGTNLAEGMAGMITGQSVMSGMSSGESIRETDFQGNLKSDNRIVENAREEAQAAGLPR